MNHSRAQIVATLGPKTRSISSLRILIEGGVDVVRLNFAHDTIEEHRQAIHNTRIAASEHERYIPIIGDLAGPRVENEKDHGYNTDVLSPITEEDRDVVAFCIEQEIDYLGLSYVGSASDIEDLQRILWEENSSIKTIAKIERIEALRNLEEIANSADAVMIARGDLGHEIPIEQIPYIQNTIIKTLNWVHKPVITATEMLSSMIENPKPTRAEVSDIAYAIMNGSDALMLSEETAIGKYPIEAVQVMERIIVEAERHTPERDVHLL